MDVSIDMGNNQFDMLTIEENNERDKSFHRFDYQFRQFSMKRLRI